MTQNTLFTADDAPTAPPQNVVSVLVPFPVDKAYDYAVPDGLHVSAGDIVVVPFKNRDVKGVVWGEGTAQGEGKKPKKLKSIVYKFDMPPLPAAHRKFIEWTARYTVSPLGSVLKMTLNTPKALEGETPRMGYVLSPDVKA